MKPRAFRPIAVRVGPGVHIYPLKERRRMSKLDDAIQGGVLRRVDDAWHVYMENLFASMQKMEQTVNEAAEMPMDCTEDWCANARALLDDLNHQVFSIHEPKWSTPEDSARIKAMKKKVYDIYARLAAIEPGKRD
jgi:hypothetical protein